MRWDSPRFTATGPLLPTSHTVSVVYQTLLRFLLHLIYLLVIPKFSVWLFLLYVKPKYLSLLNKYASIAYSILKLNSNV